MWKRVIGAIKDRRVQVGLAIVGGLAVYWFLLRLPRPPEEDLVATYRGGKVTREELRRYLHEFLPRCSRHLRCSRHGEEHEECEPDEACEQFLDCPPDEHAQGHHPMVYRRAVTALIVDRLIAKRVAEKQLAERGESRHLMKHVGEELSLTDLDKTLHATEMRVEATEVREYYEKNRSLFGERTLSDVSPQIEEILSREREKGFFQEYIRRLKEEAVVSMNYDLLQWPEPSEAELRVMFTEKARSLVRPGRAKLLLISVPLGSSEAEDVVKKARSRLLGGLTRQEIASDLGDVAGASVSDQWVEEESALGRALQLSRRFPGEVSDIAEHEGARCVARILEREERRQMLFEEARSDLLGEAKKTAKERFVKENSGATLFTVRGKPYSLGEFRREFQELSPLDQARYATFEERKELLDRMLERAVLVEKASESARTKKSKKQYDRVRASVLRQLLHQEEVDDQLTVSEEEAGMFFEKHRTYYRQPARVKVSYIRLALGGPSRNDAGKARQRAKEALTALKDSKVDEARFAKVAREYSDDPDVATTGGKVEDWISETDDLMTELFTHHFHENVLRLKQGEISPVFLMGNDFYVVWVREREEARDRSFEEARELVTRDITASRHEEMTHRMELELVQKAKIKIYDYTILEMLKEERRQSRVQAERSESGGVK